MLRRIARPVLVGGLLCVVVVAAPANADPPTCVEVDQLTGVCTLFAGGGGDQGGDDPATPVSDTPGDGDDGATSPVIVIDGQECLPSGLADPQPSQGDPVWAGHTDGAIYSCITNPEGLLGTQATILFWAAAPPAAPPPPDPEVLAQQAVASMGLSAIDIGIVPEPTAGSVGIIGMPTWMWAENPGESTVGPITRTASAGGFTVTATARLDRLLWTMGDGATITCVGAGTPYDDAYGKASSPDCGHTYTEQGRYAVSATSFWNVAWSGIGETGTIPLDFTNTTTITMGEAQVITK